MGRVILAEDDEIIAKLVVDRFIAAGHGIGWLRDGVEALEAMKFRPPDLAILDQRMPSMNGQLVLRAMRLDKNLAMVPVMMLTAVSGKGDQRTAYFHGADDYMTKPFDVDQLLFRAEELIANRIRRTSGVPDA